MNCKMIEEARATGRGNNLLVEMIRIFFVTMFVAMCAAGASELAEAMIPGEESENTQTLIALWMEALPIALILLYCRFAEQRPISSVGFVRKDFWKEYLKGAAVGFGLFASVVIVGTAIGAFRFNGLSDSIDPVILLLFLSGYMIQGMSEEVLCRGYMMVSAARKNSVPAAVIVNSAAFALLHTANPGFDVVPCLNLILFAVIASVYMLKTGNIWGVGAMHSVWNFVQGNFFGLNVSGTGLTPTVFVFESTDMTWANGGAFGPEGGAVVTIVLVVELVVLLVPFIRKKK